MYKKLIYLVSFVLVVSQACSAVEVARWDFEETSGNTATDQSGLYVATFEGSDTLDVDGKFGSGVDIAGDGGAIIDITDSEAFQFTGDFSISLWVRSDVEFGAHTRFIDISAADGGLADSYRLFTHSGDDTDNFKFMSRQDGSNTQNIHTRDMPAGTWIMLVLRHDLDGDVTMNVLLDGDSVDAAFVAANSESWPTAGPIVYAAAELKLGRMNGTGRKFDGQMDALAFYDEVLTDDQIVSMFYSAGSSDYPLALCPKPADRTMISDTWVNLSWRPGDFAISHDVYIGDNFDDVYSGAEGTFQGNQTTTAITLGFPGFAFPDGLTPGTTYYWRIDEVNEAEPNSPWKGDLWSFSVPPKTAYLPEPADGAEAVAVNVQLSWTGGHGAKLHHVYFGETFDEVDSASGALPQGNPTYTPGPLKMAKTYYWRVDEFDVVETYKGNVWSFTTEGGVGSPNPAKGTVDVTQTPVLTWSPGLGDTHEIYFGADAGALEKKGGGSLGSESFEPGQLEWNTTYYWRIDEANSANADSPWAGPLWSFTTANFIIIDDMESYNDLDPDDPNSNRIFNAWIDGFDNPAVNGSVVGNINAPFAEQTIVNSGIQSMPMAYDNSIGKSEATLTLTSNRDWTVNGVDTLTIWFRGTSANTAETLYVALDGTARVDNDNPDAAVITRWTQWDIPLQAFADQGINLADVNSITLGLSSVTGGTGMMYFDDIRLYPPAQ
ncbi:MAG: LamG-like jellyroll fold domain-containing protein [Sedimentisphaerales bacterium]|nr:LamG-like jellyroll fold domain-containing protein [Sedimentisphaerales bacterium]